MTTTWREAEWATMHDSAIGQIALTGAPWLTLLKFSSGEWNISAAEREVLLAHGLIECKSGASVLTPRGRQALGLAT